MDFTFDNLQRSICHKTQTTNEPIWQGSSIYPSFHSLFLLSGPPERQNLQDVRFFTLLIIIIIIIIIIVVVVAMVGVEY